MNRTDTIAEIKTAHDEARIKANAYKHLTAERYNYWRAVSAVRAYDQALTMFARGTEHKIPDMAAYALAKFEWARDNDDTPEMTLAAMDGRRDALNTVVDWMSNR